ncbi:hypothetical protein [Pseudonocardia spinosispora]|uniref:hypothetical protein n=1 Tax=Pseudonocardia spinosispora TaxID=103441 RepID=UPI0004062F2B|nr:hypothetical protein [Pseudonocardia spinosispora]
MSALRAPRVAGIAGGVGTTTVATALRGYDRGRAADEGVEVLVCRSTGMSLHAAASAVTWLVENGRQRPVLVVNADLPGPLRGPLRARIRMVEPQVAGLIVLPYVVHWREQADPLAEAARLSECSIDQLPRGLRGYGEGIAAIAETVLRSGMLRTGVERPGGPHTSPPLNRTTGPHTFPGMSHDPGPISGPIGSPGPGTGPQPLGGLSHFDLVAGGAASVGLGGS